MKTSILTYCAGLGLLAVLAGAIGYWHLGDSAPAADSGAVTGNRGARSPGTFRSSVTGLDSGRSSGPASLPAEGANAVGFPRQTGFGSIGAQESRALTDSEKEKVAAAMSIFQGKLQQIAGAQGHSRKLLAEYLSRVSAQHTPVRVGGERQDGDSGAQETVSTVLSGELLTSEVSYDTSYVSYTIDNSFRTPQPIGTNEVETEQIGAASRSLTEVLRQFEPGSPAWKDARRQGEELMRKMQSAAKVQAFYGSELRLTDLSVNVVAFSGKREAVTPPVKVAPVLKR